jgi:hypothetical protein
MKGYFMNSLKHVICVLSVLSVLCSGVLAGTTEIVISGVITDGSSPLEGVSVALPGSVVDTASGMQNRPPEAPPFVILDNLKSDSEGKFSTRVTVQDTLSQIRAITGKKDYLLGGDSTANSGTEIDLGTIALTKAFQKGSNQALDDVLVKGTIVDADENAVQGATVLLGEIRIGPQNALKVLDNLETGADGKFTRSVNYTPNGMQEVIVLMVFKKGFVQRITPIPIDGSNADAGTVILKKPLITAITNFPIIKSNLFSQPKTVTLFSVDGKKLYSGKILDLNRILSKYSISCQPIIVQYDFKENTSVHYKAMYMQK